MSVDLDAAEDHLKLVGEDFASWRYACEVKEVIDYARELEKENERLRRPPGFVVMPPQTTAAEMEALAKNFRTNGIVPEGPRAVFSSSKGIAPFMLHRDEDETGISGTGDVAWGVRFPDGVCVLRWNSEHKSTAVYNNIDDLDAIHGHGGKTQVVWL